MKPLDKIDVALRSIKAKNITIKPGPAAFDWTGPDSNVPLFCSGFGALILFYELRGFPNESGGVARLGWLKVLADKLSVSEWWLRRFYCGFELGRIVYIKTSTKTNLFYFDAKRRKHYMKEDTVSKESIKLRKRLK
ncbi:hypothetical protein LCGC14_0547130 [marine sediment metagenome]|uniref:Uncharacterized protein n=1 Tax=marine sediment metagenome TaxID=412755 RepID=A0A0F9UCC9_9ZZZZ